MLPATPGEARGSLNLPSCQLRVPSPSGSWTMVLVEGHLKGEVQLSIPGRLPAGVLHLLRSPPSPPSSPCPHSSSFSPSSSFLSSPRLLLLLLSVFLSTISVHSDLDTDIPKPFCSTVLGSVSLAGDLVEGLLCCRLLGPWMRPPTSLGRSLFTCKLRG